MQIEVFSDVVCPWCYIGKRRLEQALSTFPHADEVTITYRSFQLDPTAPRRSEESLEQHLATKYGRTLDEARQMNQRVSDVAATVGLDFRLEDAQRGNTFDAHRLLQLAAARGRQPELKERLMKAYFSEGGLLSDHNELVALAAQVGLDPAEVAAVLAGDDYADAVRADLALARGFGVTGVPFFVVDRTYGVSGAQEAAVLTDVLQRAWTEAHPLTVLTPDGPADDCTDGVCEVR
jgi:predicted DsbA family dithiol-disulfide isomerase